MLPRSQRGIRQLIRQRNFSSYKSPYGPDYKFRPNINGIGPTQALNIGITVASFGAVAGVFALFFFSEIPKVRKDIMRKVPVIGTYFRRDVPPSDNPF